MVAKGVSAAGLDMGFESFLPLQKRERGLPGRALALFIPTFTFTTYCLVLLIFARCWPSFAGPDLSAAGPSTTQSIKLL